MMKNFITILALVLTLNIYSQERISYYTKSGTVKFIKSNNLIYIENSGSLSKLANEKIKDSGDNFVIIESTVANNKEKIETFKKLFKNVEPVLIYEDGVKQICVDEIIVKTKSNLQDVFKGIDYTFTVNELEKNQYVVRLIGFDTDKTFRLISTLSNDLRIEYIEPNFIKLNILYSPPPNDPFLPSQWSIKNNGYLGGTPDADMDVDDAWTISTGAGIKVAIIDEGVDLAHIDLQANLLVGFDATGGTTNGGSENNDAHGTACAGIVGAVANNGIGVVGVAYNSKMLPIRIARRVPGSSWTTDAWLANGINWAWQNGADILSNSWGGGSVSITINNAINSAVTNGRGGKGCIVVFAAGNNNSIVSNPATNPQVIAVGATSQCDQRKSLTSCDGETYWGSNYGAHLDISAPGVKIYTTDISGIAGYEVGSYATSFNGISSACPNVAGVVALILSLKPSLTGIEARQILEQNTDKVGGYVYTAGIAGQPNGTWSNDLGYGRVNAYKALLSIAPDINGVNSVCSAPTTFTLTNSTSAPTWSVTTGLLQIVSSTNNTVTVQGLSSGPGIITATLANGQIATKTIWVGAPTYQKLLTYSNIPYDSSQLNGPYWNPTWFFKTNSPNDLVEEFIFKDSNDNFIISKFSNSGIVEVSANEIGISSGTQKILHVYTKNVCGFLNPLKKLIVRATLYYPTLCQFGIGQGCQLARMANISTNVFSVYPNPANDYVNIELNNMDNQLEKNIKISGELFNLMGLSTLKVEVKGTKSMFSVKGLKPGIYILKIYSDDQVEAHQILVE